MPPVGSGYVLSNNQIRYCVSQGIRIETMKGLIDRYSQNEVDQFNVTVSDYNSRCMNYRYRGGALETVRGQVEANRSSLISEARNKILSWRQSTTTLTPQEPSYGFQRRP